MIFALDGAHVLCADYDGNVKMMIWRSGGLVTRLCQSRVEQTHRAWVLDSVFSADRQRTIYTISFNGDTKIWTNPSFGNKVPVRTHALWFRILSLLGLNLQLRWQATNAMVPLQQHLPGKLNFATAPATHKLAPGCGCVAVSHDTHRVRRGWVASTNCAWLVDSPAGLAVAVQMITTAENGAVRFWGSPRVRFSHINAVPIQPQKRPPGMSLLGSYRVRGLVNADHSSFVHDAIRRGCISLGMMLATLLQWHAQRSNGPPRTSTSSQAG